MSAGLTPDEHKVLWAIALGVLTYNGDLYWQPYLGGEPVWTEFASLVRRDLLEFNGQWYVLTDLGKKRL